MQQTGLVSLPLGFHTIALWLPGIFTNLCSPELEVKVILNSFSRFTGGVVDRHIWYSNYLFHRWKPVFIRTSNCEVKGASLCWLLMYKEGHPCYRSIIFKEHQCGEQAIYIKQLNHLQSYKH